MDLTPTSHKIYPRTATALSETHLRPESSVQRQPYASRQEPVPAPTQQQASRQAEVARQYQEQRADQSGYGRQQSAEDAGVSKFGDQLAQASRQARHTQVRRRYTPPALVSARGREANRRYLDTSMASRPRIIDEVV